MKHLDPKSEAARLAELLTPAILEIRRSAEEEITRFREKVARDEQELLAACKAVGAAVDRLEAARYGKGEIGARKSLEASAGVLRRIMAKRKALRHGR